jgi:hypothetical protein
MRTSLRLKLLAAACAIVVVWIVVSPLFAWKQTIRRLENEALAVTPLIDSVYEYRARTGCWPAELETVAPQSAQDLANRGWRYHCVPPPVDGAQLETGGAFHTRLMYVFGAADVSPGWYCTSEGNPVAFSVPCERKR